MTTPEIIALVASISSIVFATASFLRNKKTDDKSSGEEIGSLFTELGYIKANTDEIKNEQKEQRQVNSSILARLTAVEESLKFANKRIDSLEHTESV